MNENPLPPKKSSIWQHVHNLLKDRLQRCWQVFCTWTQMKTFVCFIMLPFTIKTLFQTHTNEKEFEQSRWLTIAGCLLLRARLALGKAGERPPRPPLCTEDSRLCMSEWAPSKPGPWPTAWLRNTCMASSKRSSNLLCYINTRGMHLQLNMTNLIQVKTQLIDKQKLFEILNDLKSVFLHYCLSNKNKHTKAKKTLASN